MVYARIEPELLSAQSRPIGEVKILGRCRAQVIRKGASSDGPYGGHDSDVTGAVFGIDREIDCGGPDERRSDEVKTHSPISATVGVPRVERRGATQWA